MTWFFVFRRMEDWWRRDSPREYTPPLSVHDTSVQRLIKSMGVLEEVHDLK